MGSSQARSQIELQLPPMLQLWQCWIWAASVNYPTACGNTGSLTHWATMGTHKFYFFNVCMCPRNCLCLSPWVNGALKRWLPLPCAMLPLPHILTQKLAHMFRQLSVDLQENRTEHMKSGCHGKYGASGHHTICLAREQKRRDISMAHRKHEIVLSTFVFRSLCSDLEWVLPQ